MYSARFPALGACWFAGTGFYFWLLHCLMTSLVLYLSLLIYNDHYKMVSRFNDTQLKIALMSRHVTGPQYI